MSVPPDAIESGAWLSHQQPETFLQPRYCPHGISPPGLSIKLQSIVLLPGMAAFLLNYDLLASNKIHKLAA
jgi:hypothetical protein